MKILIDMQLSNMVRLKLEVAQKQAEQQYNKAIDMQDDLRAEEVLLICQVCRKDLNRVIRLIPKSHLSFKLERRNIQKKQLLK